MGFGLGKRGFSGFPFLGDIHEDRRDEARDADFIAKEAGDFGSPFDLSLESFAHVGSAQPASKVMRSGMPMATKMAQSRTAAKRIKLEWR